MNFDFLQRTHARLKKNDTRTFWAFLGGAAVVSGAISLWIGLRQSVWFDESYSIELAKAPVDKLIHMTGTDVHPPFYYLLLKVWGTAFDWNEVALRLLSVFMMMGALIVGGLLIRRMFGSRAAITAVLLVMIAPLLLRYGFELRQYPLASLVGVSATYALYSAWKEKNKQRQTRWLVAYGLLVALGMYTLYYMALLWVAHIVWLVFMKMKHSLAWKKLLRYFAAYVGAAVLFIPWLPTFLPQFTNGALGPAVQPLNLEQLVGIATFNVLYQPVAMVSVALTAVFIAVVAAVAWAAVKSRRALAGLSEEVVLLVLYIAVPIVIVMIISLLRPMYMERFLSHLAIGPLLLVGVLLCYAAQRIRRQWQVYLMFAIVYGAVGIGCVHLANVGNYSFQYFRTSPVREMAAAVKDDCHPGTRVLAANAYTGTELIYYLPDCPVYFVAREGSLGGGFTPLRGNPHQVTDVKKLTDKRIKYVSYGTPSHPISSEYKAVSTEEIGPASVVTYVRQ